MTAQSISKVLNFDEIVFLSAAKKSAELVPEVEKVECIKVYKAGDKSNYMVSTSINSAVATLKLKGYKYVNEIETDDGLVLFMSDADGSVINFVCEKTLA